MKTDHPLIMWFVCDTCQAITDYDKPVILPWDIQIREAKMYPYNRPLNIYLLHFV